MELKAKVDAEVEAETKMKEHNFIYIVCYCMRGIWLKFSPRHITGY